MDGHQLHHLVPPRDLHSWHNLPISAIANFKPVVVSDPSETALGELLEGHPYRHFPLVEDGAVTGIATRMEIENAIREHRPPRVERVVSCRPADSIRACQTLLVESATHTLVLTENVEGAHGKLLGIVTLHDLLRAQVAMTERER